MSGYFVYRPVLAWVIALFAILFGGIALVSLPVEQYPDVAPPSLSISATFVGADAQTLDRTVTSVIENELSGVDDFLFMTSTSRANGTAQIRVTFRSGTDLDIARSQVQDRLARVEPRLPDEVRQMGVRVTQASNGFLMLISLQSDKAAIRRWSWATTPTATSPTNCAACMGWAMSPCSAPVTRCGSGWIARSWSVMASRPVR